MSCRIIICHKNIHNFQSKFKCLLKNLAKHSLFALRGLLVPPHDFWWNIMVIWGGTAQAIRENKTALSQNDLFKTKNPAMENIAIPKTIKSHLPILEKLPTASKTLVCPSKFFSKKFWWALFSWLFKITLSVLVALSELFSKFDFASAAGSTAKIFYSIFFSGIFSGDFFPIAPDLFWSKGGCGTFRTARGVVILSA